MKQNPERSLIYLITKGDFVEKAAGGVCFITNRIKKEALLYIIVGKNWPVCFFSQGVELLFCFKNMIQKNSCFVCQGVKWRS